VQRFRRYSRRLVVMMIGLVYSIRGLAELLAR